TPSASRDAINSRSRTLPISDVGQRSSSQEPSSPRVAVTHTTRCPSLTAWAMSPAVRYVSSSGCAHTPRMVPRVASSVIHAFLSSGDGDRGAGGHGGRAKLDHPLDGTGGPHADGLGHRDLEDPFLKR